MCLFWCFAIHLPSGAIFISAISASNQKKNCFIVCKVIVRISLFWSKMIIFEYVLMTNLVNLINKTHNDHIFIIYFNFRVQRTFSLFFYALFMPFLFHTKIRDWFFFPTARQGINSRKWKINFFLLHGILWMMISVVYSRLVCNGIMVLEFREFGTYEIYYCTISQHKLLSPTFKIKNLWKKINFIEKLNCNATINLKYLLIFWLSNLMTLLWYRQSVK